MFNLLPNGVILICPYTHTHSLPFPLVFGQDSSQGNIFPNTSTLTQMQFPVKQNQIANHQSIDSLSFMQHFFYYSEKQSMALGVSEKFLLGLEK